jgi:hypothetical protein
VIYLYIFRLIINIIKKEYLDQEEIEFIKLLKIWSVKLEYKLKLLRYFLLDLYLLIVFTHYTSLNIHIQSQSRWTFTSSMFFSFV